MWVGARCSTLTYAVSGLLLAGTGYVFATNIAVGCRADDGMGRHLLLCLGGRERRLSDRQRNIPAWSSCPRNRAFLRGGTGVGGVAGPWLLGALIDSGSRLSVFAGYLIGTALMLAAALIAAVWATAAERKPLEEVARPLASVD